MKRIVIIPVFVLSLITLSKQTLISKEKATTDLTVKIKPKKANLPQKGKASFYNDKYTGKKTANAERYNPELLTAAHETLPLGTMVKVTNLKNNQTALVKINDRCACSKHGRIIDLSKSAAVQLDMIDAGIAKVIIEKVK
jgi:rare lipoprotein A